MDNIKILWIVYIICILLLIEVNSLIGLIALVVTSIHLYKHLKKYK